MASKPYERLCIGEFDKNSKYCKKCEIPFTCIEVKEKKSLVPSKNGKETSQ